MAKDARAGGGTNARPLDDTIAQTGPGIPDDALAPGEAPLGPIDEAEVQRVAEKLDAIGDVHLRRDEGRP